MVQIVNPAGQAPGQNNQFARRPRRLDNLRLGLLDNGKQNADVMVKEVGRIIGTRVPLASATYVPRLRPGMDLEARAKFGAFDNVLENLVETCDVVVAGVGD
jgi:hypothetical protein